EKARSDRRWYAAEIHLAQKDWEDAQVAALQQRLDALKPSSPDAPDLRGFEWYYLQRLCRLDLRTLTAHAAPVRWVAYSPDGRRLASLSRGVSVQGRPLPCEVKMWDTADGSEIASSRGQAATGWQGQVAFSPDGRRLAFTDGQAVAVCDAGSGKALFELP